MLQHELKIAALSEADTALLIGCTSEADVDRLADALRRPSLDLRLLWYRGREQAQGEPLYRVRAAASSRGFRQMLRLRRGAAAALQRARDPGRGIDVSDGLRINYLVDDQIIICRLNYRFYGVGIISSHSYFGACDNPTSA